MKPRLRSALPGTDGRGWPFVIVTLLAVGCAAVLVIIAPEHVPHVAVSSSLITMVPSAFGAALAQQRRGGLDGNWLAQLAPGMAIGAMFGALFAMHLRGCALSLLFAGQSLYYGWGLMQRTPPSAQGLRPHIQRVCGRLSPWIAGLSVAAFCACAGMGGGSLTVPYLCAKGLPLLRAAATSSTLNLCSAGGGGIAVALLSQGVGRDAQVRDGLRGFLRRGGVR